ncbi:MAG: ornithine carbamoyltransferase [Thermoanaerobacteraceae bacterium]|nr:ornithine carbamoyltransferase [Thermoanaerobacteraceae bacterium]
MKTKMKGKHFISLMDFSKEELETILETGFDFKKMLARGQRHEFLKGKSLGMLFAQPSTRTRVSFETGMTQLGGHAQYYTQETMQLKNKETWEDTGRILSRYLDGILVRMYDLERYGMARDIVNTIAKNATIPVINGLDDKEHPCQVMGDIMTIIEKFGENWKKRKIVMAWAYAERVKSPGVPQAMLIAASLLGMNLTLAYPKKYELDEEYMAFAENAYKKSGGTLTITNDIYEASKGADVIYAKSWGSCTMPKEEDKKYREAFKEDWCISNKHFDLANPNAYYMHPLPAARGEEVTDEVIDGPHSIVYDQAENRLHIQKAILSLLL